MRPWVSPWGSCWGSCVASAALDAGLATTCSLPMLLLPPPPRSQLLALPSVSCQHHDTRGRPGCLRGAPGARQLPGSTVGTGLCCKVRVWQPAAGRPAAARSVACTVAKQFVLPCSYAVVVSFWVILTGVDPEDVVVRVSCSSVSAGRAIAMHGRLAPAMRRALTTRVCHAPFVPGGREHSSRSHCDQPHPRRHRAAVQHLLGCVLLTASAETKGAAERFWLPCTRTVHLFPQMTCKWFLCAKWRAAPSPQMSPPPSAWTFQREQRVRGVVLHFSFTRVPVAMPPTTCPLAFLHAR